MDRNSALAEGLAAAGLSAFLFWGLRFLPFLGIAIVPAAALPLVRFGTRRGARMAAAAAAGAGLIAAAIGYSFVRSPAEAGGETAALLATAGACGIAAGLARNRRPSRVFLGLCVYGAVAGAALWASTPSMDREAGVRFDGMVQQWMASARQSGADAATLRNWQASAELVRDAVVRYAEGLIGALWVLVAAVAFYLGRRFAVRAPEDGGFARLRLPPALAGLFVLSGAAAALFRDVPRRVALDVLAPVLALYFVSGLSIIAYFARRWFRTGVLRAAVYVMASWFPFSAGTAVLGLFDWYFDFREKAEQRAIGRKE
jgi:hypothetical protein